MNEKAPTHEETWGCIVDCFPGYFGQQDWTDDEKDDAIAILVEHERLRYNALAAALLK